MNRKGENGNLFFKQLPGINNISIYPYNKTLTGSVLRVILPIIFYL